MQRHHHDRGHALFVHESQVLSTSAHKSVVRSIRASGSYRNGVFPVAWSSHIILGNVICLKWVPATGKEVNNYHDGVTIWKSFLRVLINLTSPRDYNDVIMSMMATQITSLTIVYSSVYSRCRSKKTSKLRVTGLCEGNSPMTGEFSAQRASNAENVSMW